MRHERNLDPVAGRVAALNERYHHHAATEVMHHALSDAQVGRIALVSSFGAESVVLLHMLSIMDRSVPVLFIDTEMLFHETLEYQAEVAAKLGLRDVRIIRPDRDALAAADPEGLLHRTDTDACCELRKTRPLAEALEGFDAWITGRKRFQGANRATLDFFEDEGGRRIKVNPLAHWAREDVRAYMENNNLPRHPLVAKGYPSIGCAPCTSRVGAGEDERAGRWRGQDKEECGIHFINGRVVRGPLPKDEPAAGNMVALEAPAPDTTGESEMNVIVTDEGFRADDWAHGFLPLEAWDAGEGRGTAPAAVSLPPDTDPAWLAGLVDGPAMIRITFPAFSDGRGFSLAQRLRAQGYTGRLRAAGHVLADQYAMARRAGFDEVEIDAALARRQPEAQWRFRADWQRLSYRDRLRGIERLSA